MSDTEFARTTNSDRLSATVTVAPRRTTHGSCAWSLPSRFQSLSQPQDGAITSIVQGAPGVGAIQVRATDGRASTAVVDAEDARLNGSLRSLARRVKGLNVMRSRPADSAAKQPERYYAEPASRKTPEAGRKAVKSMAARTQVA